MLLLPIACRASFWARKFISFVAFEQLKSPNDRGPWSQRPGTPGGPVQRLVPARPAELSAVADERMGESGVALLFHGASSEPPHSATWPRAWARPLPPHSERRAPADPPSRRGARAPARDHCHRPRSEPPRPGSSRGRARPPRRAAPRETARAQGEARCPRPGRASSPRGPARDEGQHAAGSAPRAIRMAISRVRPETK